MLVLSRRKDESVVVNGNIRIVVVDIRGDKVRLGIEAPDNVNVFRSELLEKPRGSSGGIPSRLCGSLTEDDLENARVLLTPGESVKSRSGSKAAFSEGSCERMKASNDDVGCKRAGQGGRDVSSSKFSDASHCFEGSKERC